MTETTEQPTETAAPRSRRAIELDPICAEAVDLAREAAAEVALEPIGEYYGCVAEDVRVVTHRFAATHRAYRGWQWSVTVTRAARAKHATVNEVVVLPGPDALVAPDWVPYADRVEPGDIAPGLVAPTPDNDPRLVPGYTGGADDAADADPADASITRALVAELGLGRSRLLSVEGRDEAAERWLDGDGGPDNEMSRQAPADCVSCGYFVRLSGSLGRLFGVCANHHSPSDGSVVHLHHGCGGHSDAVAESRIAERPPAVWDTIEFDVVPWD
ncbi:DUF3027 domain-containing protein [Enemella sp. A6]|uniref:DUF3027 domain-containing protein n=1 Tax=Enemella sp. A6 TaxID=3440152 RepID=UPI003EBACA7D